MLPFVTQHTEFTKAFFAFKEKLYRCVRKLCPFTYATKVWSYLRQLSRSTKIPNCITCWSLLL